MGLDEYGNEMWTYTDPCPLIINTRMDSLSGTYEPALTVFAISHSTIRIDKGAIKLN